MLKFHEFAHPNGRHRVEFFHEKGQTWRYERSDLVKKRWRRTPDPHPKFDSYATALVAAQRVTPWITETLREPSHNWHVELLRGLAFHSARYDASIYGDHHHCSVCWKKFLPPEVEMPDAGTYGIRYRLFRKPPYLIAMAVIHATGESGMNFPRRDRVILAFTAACFTSSGDTLLFGLPPHYEDKAFLVRNLVNDTVAFARPGIYAVEFFFGFQLLYPVRARIAGQFLNIFKDPSSDKWV